MPSLAHATSHITIGHDKFDNIERASWWRLLRALDCQLDLSHENQAQWVRVRYPGTMETFDGLAFLPKLSNIWRLWSPWHVSRHSGSVTREISHSTIVRK